jgi:hypothetical protein
MGTINHGYIDRVKYELQCAKLGSSIIITEPIGWNSDNKEFARNTDYDGIVSKFSNSLKFIDNGADYINLAFELYDVMAEIKMTKYERHPRTDKWVRSYWGYLDLMTRKMEDNQLSVKFNSGGLQEDIKSREDESVEVDRLTSIDGSAIEQINEKEVILEGRRIFLKSKWEVKASENTAYLSVFSRDGNTRSQTQGVTINLNSKSHEQAQSILADSRASEGEGSVGMMFLANFDRTREIVVKGKDFSFTPKITDSDFQWAFFKVCLTTYRKEGDLDYKLKSRINLFHAGYQSVVMSDVWSINNNKIVIPDFNIPLVVNEGDSVALEFFIKSDLKNSFGTGVRRFSVEIKEIKGTLFAEEDSRFDSTTAKCYLAHDLLNQLSSICASKNKVFYSDYFGRTDLGYSQDGPGAYIGMTHGFAVRGFTKLPIPDPDNDIENLYKPMTTSLRDALSSMKSVFNIGVGIEEVNGKERVRVEELSYFYNNNVTIRLPNQVKKLSRATATDYYWPSIEVGYESGGENEEAQGLDEPNGKSNFTTIINKGKNTYSQLSKYIGGMYAMEFTRRKTSSLFPSEDTKYDSDVFLLDLKSGNNVLEQRKWQDDFEKAPTGIFSPETATNLRLSPFNILLRHGWVLASSLTKFATDKIRYGSSTANSQMKTQLIGSNEYAENGDIINAELEKARFIGEWIEFEHDCNFDIMQMVQGTTKINGKVIQNFYGTLEFINDKGKIEKGFLFNLKPNEGKFKLLKSNR